VGGEQVPLIVDRVGEDDETLRETAGVLAEVVLLPEMPL
jgi:hypothetical protein